MKRALFTSVVVGAFGVLVLSFLLSEVDFARDLAVWPLGIAGWVSGSLHSPHPLIFLGVLFVPVFVVALGVQLVLRRSRVEGLRRHDPDQREAP